MKSSSANDADKLAPAFAALGQPARLSIMRYLISHWPDPVAAGQVQEALDIPASTLSHHLHRLREAGLVVAERESQWIRYRPVAETLRGLMDFLYAECCARRSVVDPDIAGRCC